MKSEPKKRTPPKASKLEAAVRATPKDDLLIAAVGASAGGIEAFTKLMTNLPADSGMAFVLVQHLDPKHHSMLTELLSKKTAKRVTEVTGRQMVCEWPVAAPRAGRAMDEQAAALLLLQRQTKRKGGLEFPAGGTTRLDAFPPGPLRGAGEGYQFVFRTDGKWLACSSKCARMRYFLPSMFPDYIRVVGSGPGRPGPNPPGFLAH
jgi:hypothetical protein